MKKLLSFAAITLVCVGTSALGQGYFAFTGGGKTVWENFGGTIVPSSGSVTVGFLFGTGIPAKGMSGTPTNAEAIVTWSAILDDPNFRWATNSTTGQLVIATTSSGVGVGGFSYNGGSSFPVAGTSGNTSYNVFVVGWSGAFATPWQAAASSSAVGWSNTFSYSTGSTSADFVNTFTHSGMEPFGLIIPEPSALSLSILAMAAGALFRKRPVR